MDCDRCQQPLIKIVRYGEQLIGCIDCNCWSGTKSAFVMDLSIEEIQRSETVGEHLTFDDETSGDVRGPPTSLTSLFTLAVAFGSISPLLRYYRAARSARFLLWLMQNRVAGALRTGCFPATKDQPEFDLPQCNPRQPQLRPTVSRLLDGHHYFAMEA